MQPDDRPEHTLAEQEARLATHRSSEGHKDPLPVTVGVMFIVSLLLALVLWYVGGS